jgi:hypothetical protein
VYKQLVIQRCTALSIPDSTSTQYGAQYLDIPLICFGLINILKARIYLIQEQKISYSLTLKR